MPSNPYVCDKIIIYLAVMLLWSLIRIARYNSYRRPHCFDIAAQFRIRRESSFIWLCTSDATRTAWIWKKITAQVATAAARKTSDSIHFYRKWVILFLTMGFCMCICVCACVFACFCTHWAPSSHDKPFYFARIGGNQCLVPGHSSRRFFGHINL